MKPKKTLSYSRQILYSSFLNGIAWVIAGILRMMGNNVCSIFSALLMMIGGIFCFKSVFSKREKADEMAENHEAEAIKVAYYVGLMLLIILVIILTIFYDHMGIEISWNRIIPSVIIAITGAMELIVGIVYFLLERE